MARLTEKQIQTMLRSTKGWRRSGDTLTKKIRKRDFVRALGYVQEVAFLAEHANHHPDIDIRWNTVTLVLTTHSEGGLTVRDFDLARQISALR